MEFMEWIGIPLSTDVAANFLSQNISTDSQITLGSGILGYLLGIPTSAFLAKRGLFLGSGKVYFPGAQDGAGAYLKEREILDSVGLRAREAPVDLWILSVGLPITVAVTLMTWDQAVASLSQIWDRGDAERYLMILTGIQAVLFVGLISIAAFRRRRTGRS